MEMINVFEFEWFKANPLDSTSASGADPFSFPDGEFWYETFYHRIITSLRLSEEKDIQSRDLLSTLLNQRHTPLRNDLSVYSERIAGSTALLAGAGPSIEPDISGLHDTILDFTPFVIAADGATDALLKAGIKPDLIVTDLDSASEESLVQQSNVGTGVVVHAHGDNMQLITRIVPKLGGNLFGSTQVKPLSNVCNVGGFTDGDRSCYLLARFEPKKIIIAGMDFGSREGEYSRSRAIPPPTLVSDFKRIKLNWGKASLEALIERHPEIRFVNVTKRGEEIKGATRMDYTSLRKEF